MATVFQFPGLSPDPNAAPASPPAPEEVLAATYAEVEPLVWQVPLATRWAYQRGLVTDYHKSTAAGVAHRLLDVIQLGERVLEEWPRIAFEVFAHLYGEPRALRLVDDPPGELGAALWNYLGTSDEWLELCGTCRGRRALSIETAASVLRSLFYEVLGLDQLPKDKQAVPEPDLEQSEDPAYKKQVARRQAIARKLVRGTDPSRLVFAWLLSILSQAQSYAEADQLLRDALSGLDANKGYGPGGGVAPSEDAIDMDLLRQLADMPDLKEILRIVGRMQRAAAGEQLRSPIRTTPVDVTQGRHLPDLTMTEHLLADVQPDLWAQRFHNGETLQTERIGEEALDSGDLITVVDHSQSMEGEPWRWANGLAGALTLEALKLGRRAVVARYSDIRNYRDHIVLAPEDVKGAFKILSLVPDGGTDTALALQKAAQRLAAPLRNPDIVLITDGGWPQLDEMTLRKLKGPDGLGRLFVILLEPHGSQRTIPGAEQTWVIPQLTLDVAAEVLRSIRTPNTLEATHV